MGAVGKRRPDEAAIRALIENWARAVRTKNFDGILDKHSNDSLMFDVSLPLQSPGIDAYKKTWDLFFSSSPNLVIFDIARMAISACEEGAFVRGMVCCV